MSVPSPAEIDALRSDVARLRSALIACGRNAGAYLTDEVTTDFLMLVPKEVRLKLASLGYTSAKEPPHA